MVLAGFILTFITGSIAKAEYGGMQVIVGILCGAIYLVFCLFEAELLQRFSPETGNVIFFTVQCLLVLGIGLALGPGGNWLISLPLVSLAVEHMSARWRWLVYLGILSAGILPIWVYSTWQTALMNVLFISPAILFVALFTQMRMNEQSARENAEQLTHDLEMANRQLSEYASQAEELAATQERNRLAREIHDNLGHYLTIVNVQIEAARVMLDSDPARAQDALNKAQDMARKGLNSVRESVAALRVSPVENRPLGEAISSLVAESHTSGIITDFNVIGDENEIDPRAALALYRVAQEGLTNVRKHAHASRVSVELDFSRAGTVRLVVRDDGVGAATTDGGYGLVGIRERVRLLGGVCTLDAQPGRGFELDVSLPTAEGSGNGD